MQNKIPIPDEVLAEIRQRCDRATPGPWKSFIEGRDHTSGSHFIKVGSGENRKDDIELTGATLDDQDFIAAARQDVPLLLDMIEYLLSKERTAK